MGSPDVLDSIKKGRDKILQSYEMLSSYCNQEDIPQLLTDLRNIMKSSLELEMNYRILQDCKDKVNEQCLQSENSNEEINYNNINEKLKILCEQEKSKHSTTEFENHPSYTSLQNLDSTATNAVSNETEEEDGGDLAVTQMTVQTVDPYTKAEFVNPVKNVVCGHSYEYEVILRLIKSGKKPRCCYVGCANRQPVQENNLIPDDKLKRYIARLKARKAI